MPPSIKRTAASLDDPEATRRVKFRRQVDQRSHSDHNAKSQRQSDGRDESDSGDETELAKGNDKPIKVRVRPAFIAITILIRI